MGARPHVPRLGRFLAVDPIEGGRVNDYSYVGADPVNSADLDGTLRRCTGAQQGGPDGIMRLRLNGGGECEIFAEMFAGYSAFETQKAQIRPT
jgi:hypothetical protein